MDSRNFFHDSTVEVDGTVYSLTADDCLPSQNAGNYWHGPGDPSSWLAVAIFLEARRRVGEGRNEAALALAAGALGITVESLRGSIEWHENYMRWHDGDESYSVL